LSHTKKKRRKDFVSEFIRFIVPSWRPLWLGVGRGTAMPLAPASRSIIDVSLTAAITGLKMESLA
jgi:hypothetical protein